MLSVLRPSCILKKLQLADIAKFLILETSERVRGRSLVEFQRFCHRQRSAELPNPTCGGHASSSGTTSVSRECYASSGVSSPNQEANCEQKTDIHTSCEMSRCDSKVKSVIESAADAVASISSSKPQSSGAPCFNSSLADIVKFLELVGSLKHTKRTGWVLRDVADCESISGHMYRMGMMTFLLDGTEGLNRTKCMELALVHDLAESLVGDITPFCGISKEEKKLREIKAMEDICKLIEPRGKRIMELFLEYEENQTPESKFVKDLDRLDMVLQAFEYEKRDNCVMKHQEFFDSTDGKFDHPFVRKLVREICSQRQALAEHQGITNGHNGYSEDHQANGEVNDLSQKKASSS